MKKNFCVVSKSMDLLNGKFLLRVCLGALLLMGIAVHTHAQTYHTIAIDGATGDWNSNELVYNPGNQVSVTWDANYIYVLFNGGFANSDHLNIGIDVDPGTNNNGTSVTGGFSGATFSGYLTPDYIVQSTSTTTLNYYTRSGTGWGGTTGSIYASGANLFRSGSVAEIAIPRANVGLSTNSIAFGMYFWLSNSSDANYAAFGGDNAAAGTQRTEVGWANSGTGVTVNTAMNFDYNSAETRTMGSTGTLPAIRNLYVNTNTLTTPSGSALTIGNNVTIGSGGLTLGNNINIAGNFVTNSTFTNNSKTVTMNGTTAQSIGGTTSPTFSTLGITNANANVTASSALTVTSALNINGSATLTRLDMGTNTLTLTGATSTITSGFLRSGGTITGGTNTFAASGTYEHNFTTTAGTIPTATWSTGSTCSIIGYTTVAAGNQTTIVGLNQAFSNFTWNCPSLTTQLDMRCDVNASFSIAGTLNIISTGSSFVSLAYNSSAFTASIANFNITGGTLYFIYGVTTASTYRGTINTSGTYTQSSGTVFLANGTSATRLITTQFNISGNFSQTGGTFNMTNVPPAATSPLNVTMTLSGASSTMTIGTGSTFNFCSGTLPAGAVPVLTLSGATSSLSQTGGAIDFDPSTSTGTGILNLAGSYSRSGISTLVTTGASAAKGIINFNGGSAQTLSNSSSGSLTNVDWNILNGSTVTLLTNHAINSSGGSTFTVASGGTLVSGTNVLSGAVTSTFALNSGATIKVGSVDANGALVTTATGNFGNIQTTTRTLDPNANYEYNGSGAQFTGGALPASLTGNLKINNSTGVMLTQNTAFTGAGTLTLTTGMLTTNAKTLTLISSTTGSSGSYVIADATGTVTMSSVTTAKTLPIGTSTSYAPLTLAVGSSTNYTAYVRSTTGITCGISNTSKALNLAWVLSAPTVPTSATFQWNPGTDQGASFTGNGTCEMGRIATPSTACPYTVTAIGTAANTIPNTVAATTGFATGTNTYIIGNTNAISLAAPTVATTVAANTITNVSASSGGQTITGSSLSNKGVVWNTSTGPTVVSSAGITTDGTSTADYTSSLTSLTAQTLYYVRAYATNASGTGYGNEVTFRTLSNPPTAAAGSFTATTVSSTQLDLTWTAATFPGSGATANGYIILRRSDATNPTTTGVVNGTVPGSLSLPSGTTLVTTITSGATVAYSNNTGLIANQQYNYLIIPFTWDNTNGTTYNYYLTSAPAANATTQAGAPTVTATTAATAITNTTASSGGTGLADGGSGITAKGVVWNTSTGPTVPSANSTNDGTGTADFTSSLSGLSAQTLYYVRAYATNPGGTGYGSEITFNTLSNPPTAPAGSFTATTTSNTQINLAWTTATFPGSGATANGYIILRRVDGTNPTTTGIVSGTAPGSFSLPSGTTLVTTIASGSTFSFNNTGLSSQTKYNYLIVPFTWDNSNAGTYNYYITSAPAANALTYSNPPTTQPTTFTATAASSTQINLAWNTATYPGTGASNTGYIILRRTDATDPTNSGVTNGVAPGSLTLASGTTLLTDVTSGGTLSYNNTGLSVSSQYNYMIIPYTWDGTNTATYNYFTTTPKTANATTTAPVYYWNGGTNSSNPAAGGTGNWSGANNWRLDNTGAQANWADGFAAILPTASGTVTLSASVAPTSTTINASGYTLATSGVSAITLSGGISMGANGITTSPISGADLTLSGIISGASTFTKSGAGTTTLSGTNTYTGINTFNSGTTLVSADLNLGAVPGSVTATGLTFNGGALSASSSFTLSTNRGITLSTAGTLDVASGQTLTYGGIVAGASGVLTKTGTGTLALTGSNTYTGGTVINGGVISVTNGTNTGLGTSTSAVTINNGTYSILTTFGSNSNRAITLGDPNSTINIATGISHTVGNTGTIAGSGILNKTGAGSLIIAPGNGLNFTYAGLNIAGGSFQFNRDGHLGTVPGSFSANNITLSGGTLTTATTGLTITSNRGITLATGTSSTIDAPVAALSYGGSMSGSGNVSFTSTGTINLSGTHGHTGTTTVSTGSLNLTGTISSSTTTVASGATLSGIGTAAAVTSNGTLSPAGSGAIGTLNTGNETWNTGSTIKIDISDISGSAGTINDLLAITGSLNTSGAETIALSGTISGFSYTTAASWTIATTTTGITNNASYVFTTTGLTNNIGSGTFSITTSGNNLVLNYTPGAPTVTFSTTANPSTGLVASNYNVIYQANLAVTGNNTTFTGVTYTTGGTYPTAEIAANGFKLWYSTSSTFSTGTATQIGSSLSSSTGSGESLAFTSGISQALSAGSTYYLYLTADYPISATPTKTINITATATSNYTFTSSPTTTLAGTSGAGTTQTISNPTVILFSASSGTTWLTGGNWTGGSAPNSIQIGQFQTNPTSTFRADINGGTTSVGAVEITSRSTNLTIGNNSGSATSGTFTLNGVAVNGVANVGIRQNGTGLLTIQNLGNSGSGSNTLDVGLGNTTNNVIQIDNSGGVTISSKITGANPLTKGGSGSGALTLSAANTFTGGFNLNAGTVNINNAQALGTTAGTFVINGGIIDNTSGGSITTLNYPQTWGGDFTFTGSNALNLGTGTVSLSATRQLTVSASTLTVGGIISGGSFGLTKAGAGTLLLNGVNTYTGVTTISAGTLQLGIANALSSSTNVIMNAGTLSTGSGVGVAGTVGTLQVQAASTIALGTGVHTLTFAASGGVSWTASQNLTITGWTGTAGTSGTAGKVFVGSNQNLTATQLTQIRFTGFSGTGANQLSTGEIVPCTTPSTPGTITPSTSTPCPAASVTYTISAVSSATGYSWSVPSGWSITGGTGTVSITVTVGNKSGTVSVTADNYCGSSTAATLAVYPQTNHTITIDGSLTDWSTNERVYNPGNQAYVTWDATNIYVAFSGGFGDGDKLNIGIDTDPGTNNIGSSTTGAFSGIQFGGYLTPDYIVQSTGTTNLNVYPRSGTGWGGAIGIYSASTLFRSGSLAEIAIPRTNLGSPATGVPVAVYMWYSNSSDANYASFGSDNPGTGGIARSTVVWANTGTCVTTATAASFDYTSNETRTMGSFTFRNLYVTTNSLTTSTTASSITGDVTISGGSLILGVANALSSSSNMVLTGGTFSTGASSGFGETMGTLQLLNNSTIALGTGSHTITYAASGGVSWTSGKTLTITGWTGTAGVTGTAGKIFVGSNQNLSAAQLLQVRFTGYGTGAIQLSTGELVPCTIPATPGTITPSVATPCPGSSVTYTISAVSGSTGYTWSVPSGYSITAGAGTVSITVTVGTSAGAISGNVSVTADNSCGSSIAATLGVIPQTNHTISVDGSLSDWSANEKVYNATNQAYVTWDATNIYVALNNNFSDADKLNIGIDTDPGTNNIGSSTTGAFSGAIFGGYLTPDYIIQSSGTTNLNVYPRSGTGWGSAVSIYSGSTLFRSGSVAEIVIPRNKIGSPAPGSPMAIHLWYSNSVDVYYYMFGSDNPASGGSGVMRSAAVWANTGTCVNVNTADAFDYSSNQSITMGAFTFRNLYVTANNLTGNTTAGSITGNVTISGGSFILGAANNISSASNMVLTGGTFSTGATTGFNETMGTLQLADNSTLALGTGSHVLTFAPSGGVSWTSGKTLTITGWATGAGQIFIGNSQSLTVGQLAQIQFTGYSGNTEQLPTGEIVPCRAVPTTPGTITPSVSIPCPGTSVTYSISSVSNASTYTWIVTGTGWSITAGQGTTTVTMTVGTGTGSISVTAGSNCATSTASTLTVIPLTYHSITIDGDLSDWSAARERVYNPNDQAYVTWDATNIYVAFSGGFANSDKLNIGIDVDPGTNNIGTSTTNSFAGAKFGGYLTPDFIIQSTGTTNLNVFQRSGTTWGAGTSIYTGSLLFRSGSIAEIVIPRSNLGNLATNVPIAINLWYANTGNTLYETFGSDNPSGNGILRSGVTWANTGSCVTVNTSDGFDYTSNETRTMGSFTFRNLYVTTNNLTTNTTANSITGTVTLSGGSLILGAANVISSSSNMILTGGTFTTGATTGFGETMGTLQLTDNSIIALGTGSHTITYAASGGVTWTSGKILTVTGWTGTSGASGTGGKLFIGNSQSLTAGQLAQIQFAGYVTAPIQLSTGEVVPVGSSQNDYYRSVATGNWSSTSTWQSSSDNTNWISATLVPGSSTGTGYVTVRNGHTVTVDYVASPATLTIDAGGTVVGSDDTKQLYVGLTGTGPIDITGTLTLNSGIVTASSSKWLHAGTVTVYGGGVFNNRVGNAGAVTITTFIVNNLGTYNHDAVGNGTNGATADFPGTTGNRTLQAGSNVTITKWASGGTAPNELPATAYGNLTINVASLGGSWNMINNVSNVQNDLNIISTGGPTRAFRLSATGTSNLSISGNINVSGGIFTGCSGNGTPTINVAGNVNVTGGAFNVSEGIGGNNSTSSAVLNVTGNINISAGTLSVAGANTGTCSPVINLKGGLSISGSGAYIADGGLASTSALNFVTLGAGGNIDISSSVASTFGTTEVKVSRIANILNSSNVVAASGKAFLVSGTTNIAPGAMVSGGIFNLASGGTLGIGSPSGINSAGASGNVQTTTRTFNSGGNYTYNGASGQNTGSFTTTATANTVATLEAAGAGTVTDNFGTTLTASTLKLTSGSFIVGSGNNLNIADGGSVAATSGNFNAASSGTITFLGTGTVSGTVNFYPGVYQSPSSFQAVDYGSSSTIQNFLQLNSNSYVTGSFTPSYSTGSNLIYNVSYSRNVEWAPNATSGRGYPYNVTVQNGGTLDISTNNGINGDFTMGGTLTLGTGTSSAGSLTMNNTLNKLTVNGDVLIGGNTTSGTSNLKLSSDPTSPGILVAGNWTRTATGTFTPNGRANYFIGSGTQTITANGGEIMDYLLLQKTGGGITLANNVTVNINVDFDKAGGTTGLFGIITTGTNNKLIIPNTTAGFNNYGTKGWINGNLQRATSGTSSPSYIYPLGTTSDYLEATLAFSGITAAGNVTGAAFNGDQSNLSSSAIDPNKSVNAFWRFTNSGVAATSVTPTFNYNTGITDAVTTANAFQIGRYSGAAWTYLSSVTSNATTAFGTATPLAFGDFAIGNCKTVTPATVGAPQTICSTTGSVTLSGNAPTAPETGVWTITSGPNTNAASQMNDPTLYNAVFTPSAAGTYKLVWTLSLIAPCSPTAQTSVSPDLTIVMNNASVAATALLGATTICNGGSANLSQTGGTLGTGASWNWYTTSNFASSSLVNTNPNPGADFVASPITTTTYYLRIEGTTAPCTDPASAAISVTITVNQPSTAPTGATATGLTLCAPGTVTLTETGGVLGTGATYEWATSPSFGTIISNSASFSTAIVATTTYYVRINGGTAPCSSVPTAYASVTVNIGNTWLGVNTDWFDVLNWCGGVPTSGSDITIPVTLSGNYPLVSTNASGNALVHNISILSGASVTVSGTGALSLFGAVSNSGTLDISDGTLDLAATSVSINPAALLSNAVKNLTISANTTSIASGSTVLKVTNNVSFLTSGNSFTTNGNLTLVSSADSTASVTDITHTGSTVLTGNSIAGNVSVERYIPSGRRWRFLSVNTKTGTNSNDNVLSNWMENQSNAGGRGIWITGAGGTGAGFDAFTSTPTMKWWNGSAYVGITSPTDNMHDPTGPTAYMVFVRGDRTCTGGNIFTKPTVMRTYGSLAQGTTSQNIAAAGYTGMGNPYASAVDLSKLVYSSTNTINITVWDPKTTGIYGLGAFKYLSKVAGDPDFHMLSGGDSYPIGTDIIMNTLESGQAFFIQGDGITTQTVSFTEPSKTPRARDVYFTPGHEQVLTGVLSINSAGTLTGVDALAAHFNTGYNTGIDGNDAKKMQNTSENISFKEGGSLLAINMRNIPDEHDTLWINMAGVRNTDYRWRFDLKNMDQPGRTAFLVDQFIHSETSLNLTGSASYDFTINGTPGANAADRFYIVFRPATVVPVTLTGISATRLADKTIAVKWNTENEINIDHYEVERSANGNNFGTIATAAATNNAGGSESYTKVDANPLDKDNYYRIKAISVGGRFQSSAIVKVSPITLDQSITVYPNPLTDRIMNVRFTNKAAGHYTLQLVNKAGQTVFADSETISGNNEVKTVRLPQRITAGGYDLLIRNNEGEKEVVSVVVE